MKAKFDIGDDVWRATFDASESFITCPDCGGTKHIRCILFDGSEVTIDCRGCQSGYDSPTGRVRVYDRAANAKSCTITGVSIDEGRDGLVIEYVAKGEYTYHVKEEFLFATKAEAMAKAEMMAADESAIEKVRIRKKEKDTSTWAWNVHYYRSKIRQAEKDIFYYTAKLNAATPHLKEEKAIKTIAKARGAA